MYMFLLRPPAIAAARYGVLQLVCPRYNVHKTNIIGAYNSYNSG